MRIYVNIQGLGKRKAAISAQPMELDGKPETVKELLFACVAQCVRRHQARLQQREPMPMTEADMDAMAQVGKLAFGIDYNGKEVDLLSARETAAQGYRDGLFRVFQNDEALGELDAPLTVRENDRFTFIRLTMLTGWMG